LDFDQSVRLANACALWNLKQITFQIPGVLLLEPNQYLTSALPIFFLVYSMVLRPKVDGTEIICFEMVGLVL
jgi:hypothetical protein